MSEHSHARLHIAVCDDEPLDRQLIAALSKKILTESGFSCEISTYSNGSDLLSAIIGGTEFHFLLLDVMMDGLSGMDLAVALRKLGDNTAIIFISSSLEMAMRGYEVSAVRYLGKPVQKDQLREALLFCCKNLYQNKAILLPTENGQRKIPFGDILYAEATDRVTQLFLTGGRKAEVNLKFSTLEELLPERQFVLSHRSYLVNLDYVSYVRSRELELSTGTVLPLSRYRQDDIQKRVADYLSS